MGEDVPGTPVTTTALSRKHVGRVSSATTGSPGALPRGACSFTSRDRTGAGRL